MFCDRCGTVMEQEQRFCATCGKRAGEVPGLATNGGTNAGTNVVPMMPEEGRIAGHVRMLGIFWLAISAFRLIPGIALITIFGNHFGVFPPGAPAFVPVMLVLLGRLFIISAVIGFVTGWGLLERQSWARTLSIVCGGISLVDMPFGTALGIYTLWTLLPAKSEAEYKQISSAA